MIITRTPLRISFAGGGTDICDYYRSCGGAVVSAAINKYIYISVNKKFDNAIRVSYSDTEIVNEVDELRHELVRECLKMAGIKGGIEVTSVADIPSGTGLGSSSSFTVGVLNALYAYTGRRLSSRQLAERACQIEIDILGHPIGKQDQYAVAYGGINYFKFNKDDSVTYEKVRLCEEDARKMNRTLMVFYTGITRSANGVLKEQKKNTQVKMDSLNFIKSQAELLFIELDGKGFDDSFAEILHAGWMQKCKLAGGICNTQIDDYYTKALDAGAKGGKLLGAGGGGFLLFYCDDSYQDKVRKAVGLKQMDFGLDMYGSQVVYFA